MYTCYYMLQFCTVYTHLVTLTEGDHQDDRKVTLYLTMVIAVRGHSSVKVFASKVMIVLQVVWILVSNMLVMIVLNEIQVLVSACSYTCTCTYHALNTCNICTFHLSLTLSLFLSAILLHRFFTPPQAHLLHFHPLILATTQCHALTYLPTVLDFAGLSRKIKCRPAVPETMQNILQL